MIWHVQERCVEILPPRVVTADGTAELSVAIGSCEVTSSTVRLRYVLQGTGALATIRGDWALDGRLDSQGTALRMEEHLRLDEPATADLRVTVRYRVAGEQAVGLVTEDTQFRPQDFYSGVAAIYTRGAIAHRLANDQTVTAAFRFGDRSTDKDGASLSMPVVALAFRGQGDRTSFLSLATDPFYGMQATAGLDGDHTILQREAIYRGSVLPLSQEERVAVLEWTDCGADGIFNTFYRTIPEIEPCAAWARQVAMGYYDYNSDDGRGWYNDLTRLAELIPAEQRGHVACCLHGWYDRLGFYCYDQQTDQLADTWTAFDNGAPGRKPIRMSKLEMHRKIRFAKELGFRVVLYYADCTNMTASRVQESWCGPDYRRYLYTNQAGKQPGGWTGPCGGGLQLDISLPEVRKWFADYFQALLREYGGEVDGFVLDETNYFSAGAICLRDGRPAAYGDQAQMRFIHDLAVQLQPYRRQNSDLCLFEGSHYLYGLVTHGSFTDFEGIPLVVNYRNTSIQCCWEDPGIRNVHCKYRTDPDYRYPYGLDVGLANGWGSDMGPSEIPAQRLAEVIAHFQRRVAEGPPNPKIATILGLQELLTQGQ
ncbi:MAG: hypothetical protein ACYC3X_05450 [Pirellulaceae bacterium]